MEPEVIIVVGWQGDRAVIYTGAGVLRVWSKGWREMPSLKSEQLYFGTLKIAIRVLPLFTVPKRVPTKTRFLHAPPDPKARSAPPT